MSLHRRAEGKIRTGFVVKVEDYLGRIDIMDREDVLLFDPEDEFESDLEWVLRSSQSTPEMIVDFLVKEFYVTLHHRCLILLGDPELAEQAALDTIFQAATQRHECRQHASAQAWLANLTLQNCRRQLRRPSRRQTVWQTNRTPPIRVDPERMMFRRALRALTSSDLEILLLSELFELPDEDLAELLQTSLEPIRHRLMRTHRVMDVAAEIEGGGGRIGKALAELWPKIELTPDEQTRLVSTVLNRLEQQQRQQDAMRLLQQLAAVVGMIALAAGIIWISGRYATRQTPNPFIAQTVVVTRLVYITPTPRPVKTPVPLGLASSDAQVRARLMGSQDTWQNLWAEALIYDYGPVGYVGPPEIQREQIWFNQPDHIVILSGPAGKRVRRVFFQEGGVRYLRNLEEGTVHQLGGQPLSDFSILARLLQPKTWINGPDEISPLQIGLIAGQPVVWVSVIDDGMAYRLALDRVKGVILGLREYDPETGLVFREGVFTQVAYEPKPMLSIFESGMLPTNFVRDYSGLPLPPDEVELLPAVELSPTRQALERITTQQEIDFSKSELNFQWRSQGEMISEGVSFRDVRFVPVEIFAGKNFLGEAVLANPWNLLCQRSPDGSKLALLEMPQAAPYPSGRLRWLDLTQPVDGVYQPLALLPEHREVGRDFAFSPDGNYLAFWGCWEDKPQCGIYIADLARRGAPVLWYSDYATSFRWSPDGTALGFIRWFYNEQVVLDLTNFVIRYTENLQQEDREALRPEEFAWLSEPVVEAGGLESCRLPPVLP